MYVVLFMAIFEHMVSETGTSTHHQPTSLCSPFPQYYPLSYLFHFLQKSSQTLHSISQGIALSPRQSSLGGIWYGEFLIISLASNTNLFHNYHACHFQVSPSSHILFIFVSCLQSVRVCFVLNVYTCLQGDGY